MDRRIYQKKSDEPWLINSQRISKESDLQAKSVVTNESPAQAFSQTFDAVLYDIQGIIEELHIDKFCSITGDAVKAARVVISKFDIESVIYAFARVHEYWEKVKARSSDFVINDLKKIIEDSEISLDPTILSIPLICYDKIKKSESWKSVNQEKWPVNDEDIDCVWDKFLDLLKITCRWVVEFRLKNKHLVNKYNNGNVLTKEEEKMVERVESLNGLDLHKYEILFDFKINP